MLFVLQKTLVVLAFTVAFVHVAPLDSVLRMRAALLVFRFMHISLLHLFSIRVLRFYAL